MKTLTHPLLVCLVLGLFLQGCSKSADKPKESSESASGAVAVTFPEGPVELKIKWPVGRRQVYRMEMKQSSATRLPQRQDPVLQEVNMAQEYAVSVLGERQPAGRELELEYLFASMEVMMNKRSVMSFDSSGESLETAPNPMTTFFRNLVGMRFKLLMDEKGEVEKVEGLNSFLVKLLQNAPPQGREAMTNMFSEQTFKQMVELGRGLPARPVQPGDSWSSTNHIAMGPVGKLTIHMDETFKAWEERQGRACALVDFTGEMAFAGEASAGPAGVKLQIKEGKTSGQSWFDPALGLPVEAQIDQTMSMLITAPVPKIGDRGGGTQTFPSDVQQNINIKLAEISGE